MRRFATFCAAAAVLFFAVLPAAAQGTASDRAWVLGFAGQVDEDGNDSLLATFNFGVTPRTWLGLTAGRSTSPADRADVSAEMLVASVEHRFDKLGFRFELERWGDSGVLETDDMRAGVYFDQGRFRIGAAFERRDIEVPFTILGPLGRTLTRTAQLDADGVQLDARVRPAERWQLYFSATEYDYERDLAPLPRIERLNLLSASTLTLANSFVDHVRMLGLERELGSMLLNVSYASDESAIDGSELETFDAALLFPVGRRVDLEVNVGTGRSELFGSGRYGGLLVLVYSR